MTKELGIKIKKLGNSDKDKQLKKIWELDKKIRGPFLLQGVFIDALISDIITQHFCSEESRRRLLYSMIINAGYLTFASKIKILDDLLKLKYPDLKRKYPNLIEELGEIRKFRNRIVHSMLYNADDFLEKRYSDRIKIVYYKKGQEKYQTITLTENRKRLENCTKIVIMLTHIKEEIIKIVKNEDNPKRKIEKN